MLMSNTKQQIEEMLNKVSEYNKLSGKGYGDLKDNCYICGISPSGLIEAIDRLVTEARLEEHKELLDWYTEAKIQPHIGSMVDKIQDRIAELQSQLSNKQQKKTD